jgi:crotonobetainyl-CoA:carnitine CoA-transferase CaiB-like acyl-CoA transferase
MAGTPERPQEAMVLLVDSATAFCGILGTMLALCERRRSAMAQEVSESLLCIRQNAASGALIEEARRRLDRRPCSSAHQAMHARYLQG